RLLEKLVALRFLGGVRLRKQRLEDVDVDSERVAVELVPRVRTRDHLAEPRARIGHRAPELLSRFVVFEIRPEDPDQLVGCRTLWTQGEVGEQLLCLRAKPTAARLGRRDR